ncbi:MAG: MerR family transcriptional regulator [Pseudomonadales bacterium]
MSDYTTREAAQLIGLSPAQIRRYVRRGLLSPQRGARGHYRFEFADVVVLRTVKNLLSASIAPRRALAALVALRRTMSWRSLAALRIEAHGGEVVVLEGDAGWSALSGQGSLAFAFQALAAEVAHFGARGEPDDLDYTNEPSAADWLQLAADLEGSDGVRAALAYQVVLELDPECVEAYVRLGDLQRREGRLADAHGLYEQALRRAPEHPQALFALGALAEHRGDADAAIGYYSRAATVAEAHRRLGRIFEMRGDQVSAHRHQQRYRQLRNAGDASG